MDALLTRLCRTAGTDPVGLRGCSDTLIDTLQEVGGPGRAAGLPRVARPQTMAAGPPEGAPRLDTALPRPGLLVRTVCESRP